MFRSPVPDTKLVADLAGFINEKFPKLKKFAFLYVNDDFGRGGFEAFKAAVQVHPEIMECHMVAGGFDYLLKTRMADMQAYRNFAGTVLWQLPGVRETRTYAVMEEVKSTTRLALGT